MSKKLTWKIWLLIIALVLSLLSIFGFPPAFLQKGVLITSVGADSQAFTQGLRQNQIITEVDGRKIEGIEDYTSLMQQKFPSSENLKTVITTKDSDVILFTNQTPDIIVSNIPKTKITLGLDLAGGARALIEADGKQLTQDELSDLVEITSNRFNVYGLSDVKVSPVSDLAGNRFMLIEIAGATPKDLKKLIEQQGKFEAKIGNQTVFEGGARDIASVCRNDATCAMITNCNPSQGAYYCNFRFSVYLSDVAAQRHATITKNMSINASNPEYLSKPLDLYVDDKQVDSLLISKDLKGSSTTQISISGSGKGDTEADAYADAEENMHNLQTILITGSLPYKLKIDKLDTISPVLGTQFIKAIFMAGIAALLAALLIIFIRYKKFKSSVALALTSLSEIIIILGIASMIDWNIDLPSIAGILATIGTGFDDLIILVDESTNHQIMSLKLRLKRAFAIILGAYFTSLVSLLPLMWAGAGLLKGFAITTIIGISVGVFITRPAFSDILKRFGK